MESIGERLQHARKKRQLTIEQAARDTRISRYFLECLEKEDFEVFPGESYLVGFLRKYSVYLEVDANEMVVLYQNTKLQEQPSPVDELLNRKQGKRARIVGLSLIGIMAISATIIIIGQRPQPPPVLPLPELQTVSFSSEIMEQEFEAWTSIQIKLGEERHSLELREIDFPLKLYFDEQIIQLERGDIEAVDFDADGRPDLRVIYTDTLANGNPVLRMDRVLAGIFAEESAGLEDWPVKPGLTNEPSRERLPYSITTQASPSPFFVEALFQGPVLFRYLSDDGQRAERFYNNGEQFQREISEYLYIWASNVGNLQLTVNGQEVRLGAVAETVVHKIALSNNQLELIPIY